MFRADLENSLHLGISTRYTNQDIESESTFNIETNSNPDLYKSPVIYSSRNLLPLSNGLHAILIDTS
ncbi:hypothetical protein EYC80_008768 [Monilinia laxa]|uniref:Uncharacterized protein n=1 Tax=Monilinia laxa TaxID=61186 RepID=A0A5N6K1B2_MONLA|nr:hypothetical protein EYC80_008768 [Monilinia laxa]